MCVGNCCWKLWFFCCNFNPSWWDPGWTSPPYTHMRLKIHQVEFTLDFCDFSGNMFSNTKIIFPSFIHDYRWYFHILSQIIMLNSYVCHHTTARHMRSQSSTRRGGVKCCCDNAPYLHEYYSQMWAHKLIPVCRVQVIVHTSTYTQIMKSPIFFTLYTNIIYKNQLFLFEWIVNTSYNIWHQ